MNLYKILLPEFDNSGKPTQAAHADWKRIVISLIGGLTVHLPTEGHWRDNDTGALYSERMIPYEFMCDQFKAAQIVKLAHDYFPDQLAIHVQRIGGAVNHERGHIVFGIMP